MHEVEGITRKHVGAFLGLGCHGENEKAWRGREFQMRRFGRKESNCARKCERDQDFCREKRWKLKSLRECKEMREMKRTK